MQPQPLTDRKDVYLVIQWKDALDSREPWWRRWYYEYVYLPFQRFSFKRFKVPRSKQVTVTADPDGTTHTTFSWFENGGAYDTPEEADIACVEESDGYKPIPYGRCAPRDSAEYGVVTFPRKKNPRMWGKRTMSLVVKDGKQDEQERSTLAETLSQLNRVLDRR